MNTQKIVSIATLVLTMFSTNSLAVAAQTKSRSAKVSTRRNAKPKPVPPSYEARLLMEAETGQILFEDNLHKKWPPASMVKMMLTLIVVEKVQQGSIALTDSVTVSKHASVMGGSQVYLKEGEVFTLEALMQAVLIGSANDASVAVAEHITGSVEAFIEMMNVRAMALNMNDTQYFNVHGLPPGRGQQESISSAYDTAILARELLKHPDVLRWTSTPNTHFRENTLLLKNTNRLVRSFPGADGLKTGYYSSAKCNLAATAERDGLRLIAIVMGGSTSRARFDEAERLLSLGFDNYQKWLVLEKHGSLDTRVPVLNGKRRSIQPVVADEVVVVLKKGDENNIEINPSLLDLVEAPVAYGQTLGYVSIMLPDQTMITTELIAPEAVPKMGWFERLRTKGLGFMLPNRE